jgi:hypothetical protein
MVEITVCPMPIVEAGAVTTKYAGFDAVTPGLTTVTVAVVAVATSAAAIAAVSRVLLTKMVVRALPFQFTSEPDTNPVPFTVRVKPELPGVVDAGTRGSLIKGTGLTA